MSLLYGAYLWENEMRENNIETAASSVRSLERGFDRSTHKDTRSPWNMQNWTYLANYADYLGKSVISSFP